MAYTKFSFRPRLVDELRDYNSRRFVQDCIAGITVGIVALPLAMAFGIASGVTPQAGIFTAIIAGFFISALGGSRVQIGGPAGAFIVVVYSIIEHYGLANLLIATIFAGVMMIAMGFFRMGTLIQFIPVSIIIGFTNGIAVLIALSQIKDFLGLHIDKMPGNFILQVQALAQHAHTVNLSALALASGSLIIIVAWPRLIGLIEHYFIEFRRVLEPIRAIPSTVIALVLGTLAVHFLGLNVETIGSKFGGIPSTLPSFSWPTFNFFEFEELFPPALTIALLSSIESLLCARVADNIMADDLKHVKHDPNQELMAQGVANIITPFFGGIPATGTIARTMTNVRSGAKSPIAGIVHAITLLLIVLVAAPLASQVPLATLAAILMFVAFNMGEWREFKKLLRYSINYRIILLSTFLLTVILDLSVAVQVGILLACFFFVYRISYLTTVNKISPQKLTQPLPDQVMVYTVFGSLFFGAVNKLEALIEPGQVPPKIVILELSRLINIDTSGLDALQAFYRQLQIHQSQLLLCDINPQPLDLIKRSGFIDQLGVENCLADLNQAIQRATVLRSE
jgi:sulfate permease, SulP family